MPKQTVYVRAVLKGPVYIGSSQAFRKCATARPDIVNWQNKRHGALQFDNSPKSTLASFITTKITLTY